MFYIESLINCKCYKCFFTSSSRQCQAKVRFEWGSLKLAVEMHNGLSTKKLNHSFSRKYKLCDISGVVIMSEGANGSKASLFVFTIPLLFAGTILFLAGWLVGCWVLSCCCTVNWSKCKRTYKLNWSKQPVLCVHPLLSVWMINQAYVSSCNKKEATNHKICQLFKIVALLLFQTSMNIRQSYSLKF